MPVAMASGALGPSQSRWEAAREMLGPVYGQLATTLPGRLCTALCSRSHREKPNDINEPMSGSTLGVGAPFRT